MTMKMEGKGDGLYRNSGTGHFFHRPIVGGRRTWRRLKATTATMARKELAVLRTRQLEARLGVGLDPYVALVTVGALAAEWRKRGCPDRKHRPRTGDKLKAEAGRLDRALPFWKGYKPAEIGPEDCRDFHAWRRAGSKSGLRLDRSVDAELQTLSNLFYWAASNPRKTGLRFNPLAINRPRFVDSKNVRHCTAVMPMTDEIFHQYAAHLLGSDSSRALGWQFLLEGLTGARTGEILACRVDARRAGEPGYQDETALHLKRLKRGIEPWALLEAAPGVTALRDCLGAFRNWHRERYARCPWFVPGREAKGPADRCSLTHALKRAAAELKLPTVTSHGLRAYFVRALRSLGIDDSEISKRLGQKDPALVKNTYGIVEPGFFGNKKLDFLPVGLPAWSLWAPQVVQKCTRLKISRQFPNSKIESRNGLKALRNNRKVTNTALSILR